jgi:hypothetical protein
VPQIEAPASIEAQGRVDTRMLPLEDGLSRLSFLLAGVTFLPDCIYFVIK